MEEDWFLYSITLFTFAVIFFFCYVHHTFTFFERNKLPKGPTPSFPFGNVYDVLSKENPFFFLLWKLYRRFKKKKLPFGGFYILLKPAIVCTDSYLCEKVLNSHEVFVSKEKNCVSSDCAAKIIKYFRTTIILSGHLKSANSDVNVSRLLENLFENIGVNFENITFYNNLKQILSLAYPNIFSCSPHKIYDTKALAGNLLVEHLKKNELVQNEAVEVTARCLNLLEKSSSIISMVLCALSANDEIQEDLRGEINRFIKEKTITKLEDLQELKFLNTVVAESLRLYPLEPFTYRICKEKFEIDGKVLPKNVPVFIPIYAIHHDAQNYINPELFDPDRFSEENEQFIETSKYIPFGCGPKRDSFESQIFGCVIKLILIDIIPKFKLDLSKKTKRIPIYKETVFGLRLKEDIWIKLEPL